MFFIIGNPRSGTTMLRLMLTKNPLIHIPPECGFMIWFLKDFKNKTFNKENIKQFIKSVANSSKFNFWNISEEELFSQINTESTEIFNYASLCREIYRVHMRKFKKHALLIGDKNNFHLSHILELYSLYPNAKFIHIVRDGRDVAKSYIEINKANIESSYKPNLPKNIKDIALEWVTNLDKIENSMGKINKKQKLLVQYEDLVANTEKELFRITNFLNVKYSSEMLRFYEANDEPSEFNAWKKKINYPVNNKSIGSYKKLETSILKDFECIGLHKLKKYNYI